MEKAELKQQLKSLEKKLLVIYALGLLALVFTATVSNFLLKEQAARQATSLIRRTVERGDYREVIYTLNDAKLDYFDAVVYYNEDGSKLFSLPAQLDPEFSDQKGVLSKVLYTRLSIDLFFGSEESHKIATVVFVFGRFSHVPYAVLIWLFFLVGTMPLVRSSRHRVVENYNREMLLLEETTRADLARRVRHDIRSPLGALQIATHNLTEFSAKQISIIRRATERITEIVSELELIRVSKTENGDKAVLESKKPHSILNFVQDIIQEKRTQLAYKSHIQISPDFSPDAFFLFSIVKGSEIKRSLSNIIDNAVEAVAGFGAIKISISKVGESVQISVSDNGHGMTQDDLENVLKKGFTKKATGSGLGLYYADKTIKESGGTLKIESELKKGTTVSIYLPLCPVPPWYVPQINVPLGGQVIILDDQESIHLSWKLRLDELISKGASFSVFCFKSASEFAEWHRKYHDPTGVPPLYLIDYELSYGGKTGLDLAREFRLGANTILVTGNFDSEEIQKRCIDQGVGLLPKPFLSLIELQAI